MDIGHVYLETESTYCHVWRLTKVNYGVKHHKAQSPKKMILVVS